MPNTRDSGTTIVNYTGRQLQDMPLDRLSNLTSIAAHSFTATVALWSELIENQKRFTVRLLETMGASTKAKSGYRQLSNSTLVGSTGNSRDSVGESVASAITEAPRRRRATPKATPAESEFPIKRYDTLTVQEIAGKLDRLRDRRSVRTVLAYEAKNKARKGVVVAGEARLERLSES